MSLTLGEKLQQAREARGISISEVAEHTRISPLYLSAIENNDYRTLPGGIFNKGFVKSYAKYVGIDEQEALQDYTILISQQESLSEEPQTYRPEVLTDDNTNSSSVMTIIFAVIIIGLMIAGILAGLKYWQGGETVGIANNSAQNASQTGNSSGANSAVNGNTAQAIPSVNEIKLEIKPTAALINVTATVDGKTASENVTAENPKTYTGQQSVRLKFYRGFAGKFELILNGKSISAPAVPAKGNFDFEVNKNNIVQTLQSGQLTPDENSNNGAKSPK